MKGNVDQKDKAQFSVRISFLIPVLTLELLKGLQEHEGFSFD